jgi:hypothetical protein
MPKHGTKQQGCKSAFVIKMKGIAYREKLAVCALSSVVEHYLHTTVANSQSPYSAMFF